MRTSIMETPLVTSRHERVFYGLKEKKKEEKKEHSRWKHVRGIRK